MSEKRKKFESQLDQLIQNGDLLRMAIQYECYPDAFKGQISDELGEDKVEEYVRTLPDFKSKYQAWYSEALSLIKQALPDRLDDFLSHYEYPRARKQITFENYMIRDYLQGLHVTRGIHKDTVVDASAAIPEFSQQLNIVKAAKDILDSLLVDLTGILQADLFDSEVDSARALANSGFLRASGAVCGVVIEKHLKQVCNSHAIVIKKRNPAISDFNQALKDNNVIEIAQWRRVQLLADIRNTCDHSKGNEPSKEDTDDLIAGTNKVLKTIL